MEKNRRMNNNIYNYVNPQCEMAIWSREKLIKI